MNCISHASVYSINLFTRLVTCVDCFVEFSYFYTISVKKTLSLLEVMQKFYLLMV